MNNQFRHKQVINDLEEQLFNKLESGIENKSLIFERSAWHNADVDALISFENIVYKTYLNNICVTIHKLNEYYHFGKERVLANSKYYGTISHIIKLSFNTVELFEKLENENQNQQEIEQLLKHLDESNNKTIDLLNRILA